jgi:tRNA A58 N-methylase Trm61
MLMPDPLKAIETSKNMLEKDGRIGFLLTLNKHENKLLQKLKPLIKRITTIDFGNVVYEHQFEDLL